MNPNKLQNLSDKIEGLLIAYPHLRDDDFRLVANIWHWEMKNDNSITDLLTAYATQQLTMSDTITRIRRKLQEIKPELRGKKWQERHEKETQVINEIKKIA